MTIPEAAQLVIQAGSMAKGGDVFVLDAQQRLRFRGAVDNQYGIGYTRQFASQQLLRNALDALHEIAPADRRLRIVSGVQPGGMVFVGVEDRFLRRSSNIEDANFDENQVLLHLGGQLASG